MTIKPGIKPASPASVVACRHAKQRSKLNKSHFRLVVKVMPLFIWFVLLNVCVSRKVKMPWSTRREQKPVCTSVGSPNHCLKFKKGLIYSNTICITLRAIYLLMWLLFCRQEEVKPCFSFIQRTAPRYGTFLLEHSVLLSNKFML